MPTRNVTESYVIPQTAGDTYNGNARDQIYSINPNLIGAGDTILIIDQGGNNSIELPGGLSIVSSQVVADQTILTLDNGAEIDIRGADTFTYNVGQNLAGGDTDGTEQSFTDFAQNVLGVTVPSVGGGVAEGGASTVNDDGTASPTVNILVNQDLTAVDGVVETFQYNIDSSSGLAVSLAGGDFTVDGFNAAEDSIIFNDVDTGTLTTATFGDATPTISQSVIANETNFIFAQDTNGDTYQLTLTGVADQDLQQIGFSVANGGGSAPEPTPEPPQGDDHGDTFATASTWDGSDLSAEIEVEGDEDMFAVTLFDDREYTFGMTKQDNSNLDPYLYLYGSNENLLADNDDAGTGLNSELVFTPSESGTYYLKASTFSNLTTGNYLLTQSEQPLATPEPTPTAEGFAYTLNYLNSGDMGGAFDDINTSVNAALQYWGQFILGSNDSDIAVDIEYAPDSGSTLASAGSTYSMPTGTFIDGTEVYMPSFQHELTTGDDANGSAADAQITIRSNDLSPTQWWYDPTPMDRSDNAPGSGQFDFMGVMLHEVGHALGFTTFNEYNSTSGFVQNSSGITTYDAHIGWNASETEFRFTGSNAEAVYADLGGQGSVPLYVAPDEPGSSFAHYGGRGSEAGLLEGFLMNPSVPSGSVLDVSTLDLAILSDMGYSITNTDRAIQPNEISELQPQLQDLWVESTEGQWLV